MNAAHLPTVLVAALVVLFPGAALGPAAGWEVELLRLYGILLIGITLNWSWASSRPAMSRKLKGRTALSVVALAGYFLTASSPFLLCAWCMAAAGVLTTWTERAHQAANSLYETLRTQLGPEQGPRSSLRF